MGQALYRKNRPKKLDEVLGQEHVVATLQNALKSGKISHAYLFTGPRGVGKTSVARILAHEVNNLPYTEESAQLDIIEIDAASNRRIDEIRDLRDKVHIMPTSGKYKVYIIDEVHMLTKEAFNALLKTLEEPPAHVIFILATTEAHKLPETIISRTQRFSFKPIENSQAVKRLRQMATSERIDIDDDALELIAQHGEGSFRDSISLLDQASSSTKRVSLEDIQQMLGIAPAGAIKQLIEVVSGSSPQELLNLLSQLREQGYQAANLAKQLAQALRQQMIEGNSVQDSSITIELLKQLLEIASSSQPDRLLEIVLLGVVLRSAKPVLQPAPTEIPKEEAKAPVETPKATKPAKVESKVPSETLQVKTAKKGRFSLKDWPEVLAAVKNQHNTLYSMLRMAEPALDGQTLILKFQFSFHKKQLSEAKNQQLLADIIGTYSQEPVLISYQTVKKTTIPKPAPETSPVETINNIFGDSEVLES